MFNYILKWHLAKGMIENCKYMNHFEVTNLWPQVWGNKSVSFGSRIVSLPQQPWPPSHSVLQWWVLQLCLYIKCEWELPKRCYVGVIISEAPLYSNTARGRLNHVVLTNIIWLAKAQKKENFTLKWTRVDRRVTTTRIKNINGRTESLFNENLSSIFSES